MPYVFFYSTYNDEVRSVDNTTDHYTIHKDEEPLGQKLHQLLEAHDNVACYGFAKIEAGSEPQWTNNNLL